MNVGSVDWQKYEDRVIVSPLYVVFGVSDRLDRQYLLHYLKSDMMLSFIKEYATGSVRDNLKLTDLGKFPINLRPVEEQCQIAATLDKIDDLIVKRRQQLDKLDKMVKARFVEMFGDPVENPYGFRKVALSELAEIKIGPFGSLLHKEDYIEGGHPLLNPSHIVDGKVAPDSKLTISDKKYDELEAYHLHTGDVVMGRRGEMGRCAVVPSEGFLCGTGSLLIRTKGEVTADYIQKIISFPSFRKMIEDMAVGQTMPNLNVPIVSKFQIIKPPIEVQKNYYKFVEQTDKSKLAIQKYLDKLET
ncbi:MAG: restriction endonuclease subunit S, partial [Hydrogeniiclostridium mannosilyticum]